VFNVKVVLLNHPLLKIEVLRKNVTPESSGIVGRLSKEREPVRHGSTCSKGDGYAIGKTGGVCPARGSHGRTASKGESKKSRFLEKWWVLPQPLPSLVPGRIVEDGVPRADDGLIAPKRLPS